MRTNKKTIDIAWIRLQIRQCVRAREKDKGIPAFYSSDNHEKSHKLLFKETLKKRKSGKKHFHYCKSDRAIEVASKKIYEKLKNV